MFRVVNTHEMLPLTVLAAVFGDWVLSFTCLAFILHLLCLWLEYVLLLSFSQLQNSVAKLEQRNLFLRLWYRRKPLQMFPPYSMLKMLCISNCQKLCSSSLYSNAIKSIVSFYANRSAIFASLNLVVWACLMLHNVTPSPATQLIMVTTYALR